MLVQFRLTFARLARLARFDRDVLNEVRHDPGAMVPAVVVAVGSMLLYGVGGWLWWVRADFSDAGTLFLKSVLIGTLFAVALWLVWLLVVYLVLLQLARVMVPVDQLLRGAGFATTPLAVGLLMVVPGVSFGVGILALGGWLLLTQVVIERCAPRAGGVATLANLAGFGVWLAVMSLLALGDDPLVPGAFLVEALSSGG